MALVGEVKELGRNSTHTGKVEGLHTLCNRNTVVMLVVDHEDWSVPFRNRLVWRIGIAGIHSTIAAFGCMAKAFLQSGLSEV